MNLKIENVLKDLNKKFGEGTVYALGNAPKVSIDRIPSGILGVDAILDGGFPRGRIVELYGEESCYKTSIALHVAANAQKMGGTAAIIDLEHAFNAEWAEKIGVNINELIVSQPDDGNDAFEIMEAVVKSGECSVIILDSVAAVVPKQEMDADYGDALPGLIARLMGQAMRKLTGIISKSNCCVIFINQMRANMGTGGYGPEKTTTGGRALKFYSSIRFEFSKVGQIKGAGDEIIGYQYKANNIKNKLGAPFKKYNFDIYFDTAFSKEAELIELGVEGKFIEKGGSWFNYNGLKIQGKDKFKQYLMENPEITAELETKVKGWLGL